MAIERQDLSGIAGENEVPKQQLPTPTIIDRTRDSSRIVITGMSALAPTGTSPDEIWKNQIQGNQNFTVVDEKSFSIFDSMRKALRENKDHPLLRQGLSKEEADTAIIDLISRKNYLPVSVRGAVSHEKEIVTDSILIEMIQQKLDKIGYTNIGEDGEVNLKQFVKVGKFDTAILQSIYMSLTALEDAKLISEEGLLCTNPTVNLGHGFAGLRNVEKGGGFEGLVHGTRMSMGPKYLVGALPNMPAPITGNVVGTNNFTSTDDQACAAGLYAISRAVDSIMLGKTDVAIAGGNDGMTDCLFGIVGFGRMGALSRGYEDRPSEASRPFSKELDGAIKGFTLGDGGGIFTLETLEHATKRQATPLAEIRGIGLSNCRPIATKGTPLSSGTVQGQAMCMEQALLHAGMSREGFKEVGGVIIEHGTATGAGDSTAAKSINQVYGDGATIIAPKSVIGHALGGSGPQSIALGVKMMEEGTIPGDIHYNKDTRMDGLPAGFKIVENTITQKVGAVAVHAFGFGGHNASVIITPVD